MNGATLGEILRAGDWKSPAFLLYLDAEQLEMDRVAEAHDIYGSSDEEDGMRCCVQSGHVDSFIGVLWAGI